MGNENNEIPFPTGDAPKRMLRLPDRVQKWGGWRWFRIKTLLCVCAFVRENGARSKDPQKIPKDPPKFPEDPQKFPKDPQKVSKDPQKVSTVQPRHGRIYARSAPRGNRAFFEDP